KFNRYSFFETPKVLLLAWDRIFKIKDALGTKQYNPEDLQELFRKLSNDVQNIHEELVEYINTPGWNHPAFYDDDDDDDDVDCTIAITPVLSTEEPVDSLSMGDEHLDTIPATGSDEASPPDFELVSSEVMEIVIPEVGRIDDDILLTIKDDILREKLLNVNLLITKIEAFNDNPTPSSDCKTKSSASSLNSLLEETKTFHNSLPEFENFYFDLGEISSGSTTTHSDISLPDYEAFYFDDDHIKEISSGSTTTHSDISLSEYDSFTFDLSNDQFPPTYKIDFTHEEFVDELGHIISPPKYDCFYFWNLQDPGELMSILNFGIRENLSTTGVNLPIEDDHSPLLAYVVWIFLAYLTYPVILPYLHPFGNEDTIFNPCITINRVYSFNPGLSHRYGAFKKFNTHRSHLNEWPMIINGKNITILDYVEASPHDSELVSLEVAEIVIPEVEEIEDDNLREKLLNVHLLMANIEALKDNPTQSSKLLTKSSSTSPKSFLEETNTFHNSLPEFENFYFDLEEISSGSTATHSDISLSEYDSFVFDPSNDQFPLPDRSDLTHEEFADELAHIISPPEYDCFYFWNLPDPGELMSILNFGIHENLSTTSVNLPIEDDHSPLLAYVGRLRCKCVTKQIVGVISKGLALRVVLWVSYSEDESKQRVYMGLTNQCS
nr:hypothetical protein [Tanacetum cinerariifolium]